MFKKLIKVLFGNEKEVKQKQINNTVKNKQEIQHTEIKSKSVYQHPKDYVVIDFETTGLDDNIDRVTEVCAIRYRDYDEVDRFTTLINPMKMIPKVVQNKTKITNEMVSNSPRFSTIAKQLVDFIGNDVVVGYNVKFDIKFLTEELKRSNIEVRQYTFLDVYKMAKNVFDTKNYKLETIKKHLNINATSHRADGDCYVTNEIYKISHMALRGYSPEITVYDRLRLDNGYEIEKQGDIDGELSMYDICFECGMRNKTLIDRMLM